MACRHFQFNLQMFMIQVQRYRNQEHQLYSRQSMSHLMRIYSKIFAKICILRNKVGFTLKENQLRMVSIYISFLRRKVDVGTDICRDAVPNLPDFCTLLAGSRYRSGWDKVWNLPVFFAALAEKRCQTCRVRGRYRFRRR